MKKLEQLQSELEQLEGAMYDAGVEYERAYNEYIDSTYEGGVADCSAHEKAYEQYVITDAAYQKARLLT